jgi:uncharacterized protein
MAQPVLSFMASHSFSKYIRWPLRSILLAACIVVFAGSLPSGSTWAQTVDQVVGQAKQGFVTDVAGILTSTGKTEIEALCTELNQKTKVQIAVVTIKSLEGRPIEDYSVDLATRLGIGPKSTDEGVLILLALDDRKNRIETGYGLEPILPDGKTGDFQREAAPLLRENNYDAALLLMARRVADVIAADKGVTLSGAALPRAAADANPHIPPFLIFLIIFVVYSIIHGIIVSRRGGPRGLGPRGGGGGWVAPFILGNMIGRGGWGGGGFGGGGGGGGFGGFGGGGFGGGGSTGSW